MHRAAWKQVVPQLVAMGVLTTIDGNALARYCRLWSRWRKMETFIETDVHPWNSRILDLNGSMAIG